jgi:hypothetical protein
MSDGPPFGPLREGAIVTDLTAETGGAPTPSERVKKPRKTYRQDWPAYNLAQARELRDVVYLAQDLCDTIPEEMSFQEPRGRHRIPLRDVAIPTILKAYHGLPGRRLGSLRDGGPLADLHDAGFISRAMHWNSVGNALRNERMSEVFQYLVEASAMPLIPVEQGDFSIDASVVNGAGRVHEGDPRYRGQSEHRIAKVHHVIGNRSGIVTAAAIEGPGAAESPMLPGLIYTTSKSFRIRNVFGDMAYTDYRSYRVVEALGGQGWFRFKETHTGRGGGAFGRMYHWAAAHPDEFFAMYFKRSNVEAVISAWKRTLLGGLRHKTETLRSKKETPMRNELYSVLVAHNIRVVIKFMYLLGIAPNFLPDAKDAPAYPSDDPLPLAH